jgi:nuclear pore complex protein Nup155
LIYLGDSSNNYQPITKNTTIIETAGHMCRQTQRAFHPEVFALESLHIISKAESRYVHLMAITAAGFRLYFTHYKDGFRNASTYMNPPSEIPNALEMGHIRVPATPLTQTPGEPSLFCSYAYYDCGITLTVRTVNEDIDSINMTSLAHHTINTASQQISQPTSYIGMPVVSKILYGYDNKNTRVTFHLLRRRSNHHL